MDGDILYRVRLEASLGGWEHPYREISMGVSCCCPATPPFRLTRRLITVKSPVYHHGLPMVSGRGTCSMCVKRKLAAHSGSAILWNGLLVFVQYTAPTIAHSAGSR